MDAKIVTVLLVLVSVQSFEAFSSNKIQPRISKENVVDYLKELGVKIKKDLENIKEEAEHFEDRVTESFNKITVSELLADLEKKIEDITEESHISLIDAIKCLAMEQEELEELVKSANEGIEKCSNEVKPIQDEITKEITAVTIKVQDVDSNITIGIWKCYYSNLSHPEKVFGCLLKLVLPVTTAVDAVSTDIRLAEECSQQLGERAVHNVSECIAQLQKELVKQENVILEHFQKCIK